MEKINNNKVVAGLIIASAILVVIIGGFLIISSMSKTKKVDNDTHSSVTPIQQSETNRSAKAMLSPAPTITPMPVDPARYKDLKSWSDYQPFPSIDASKKIDDVQFKELTTSIPIEAVVMPLYSYEYFNSDRKANPSLQYGANIQKGYLRIYNNQQDKLFKSVALENSTLAVNFAWITNELILLLEQSQKQGRDITTFYLVDPSLNSKLKIGDDSSIREGIDIKLGPIAYNSLNNSVIVFTTTEGYEWQLVLTQY